MIGSVKAGDFLLARPELLDPNFDSCVVLLCEHSENGSFGLVLNRPIDALAPATMLPESPWISSACAKIFWGGPVQETRMHALHSAPPTGDDAMLIRPGISFGGDLEALEDIHSAGHHIRLFMGYSGWDGGQLQAELDQGTWMTTPATEELLWSTPIEKLWRRLVGDADPQMKWLDAEPGCN